MLGATTLTIPQCLRTGQLASVSNTVQSMLPVIAVRVCSRRSYKYKRQCPRAVFGSMIDLESHKISRVVLSITVSELYSCTIMFLELVNFLVACGWISVPRAWLFTRGPMLIIWSLLLPQPDCQSKGSKSHDSNGTQGIVRWAN